MANIIDTDHPFFRPLWRRVAIVVACLGWAVVETLLKNEIWAIVFGGIGLYAAFVLLIDYTPPDDPDG